MQNSFTEIERKFLINSFPDSLPLKEEFQVYQAYLSIDPEVRIRRNVVNGQDKAYYAGKSLAFPFGFGCGLANGDWEIVSQMIETYFKDMDVTIYQLPPAAA